MNLFANINIYSILIFLAFAALESLSLHKVRKQLAPKEHIMLMIAEIVALIGIVFL